MSPYASASSAGDVLVFSMVPVRESKRSRSWRCTGRRVARDRGGRPAADRRNGRFGMLARRTLHSNDASAGRQRYEGRVASGQRPCLPSTSCTDRPRRSPTLQTRPLGQTHSDARRPRRGAQTDEHARIVGRRVAAVGTRAPPQHRPVARTMPTRAPTMSRAARRLRRRAAARSSGCALPDLVHEQTHAARRRWRRARRYRRRCRHRRTPRRGSPRRARTPCRRGQ